MSKIFTVSEISTCISDAISEIGSVAVLGEISGYKKAGSGHRYFTLKDESSQLSCTMWASRRLEFAPAEGMKVVAEGNLTIYPPRGCYQLDCLSLRVWGVGELFLAFEQLKQELKQRGYFDLHRKRPLPDLPLHIGVVTSASGAVIRDILSTLERRAPYCQIYFCPASVQGENAPNEIACAIGSLNQRLAGVDSAVLIVGRGGGSLQDLWAFNSMEVAEAIYRSAIPVIAGVGHETDSTLADFVADVRAATPTAAAELVSRRDKRQLMQELEQIEDGLTTVVKDRLMDCQQVIEGWSGNYGVRRLVSLLGSQAQSLDEWESRLKDTVRRSLEQRREGLAMMNDYLRSLHPLAPLKRGFALLKDKSGFVSADVGLEVGQIVEIVREGESAMVVVREVKQYEI